MKPADREALVQAVRAAREMIETIALFNVERQAASKPAIAIGIGIASGAMVAGFAGTNERATYTCVGDTVNLAARLEAHTKVAGHGILVDGETCTALGGRLEVCALGAVQFKGKGALVDVFAVAAKQVP